MLILGVMMRQFGVKLLDLVPYARTVFEATRIPEHYAAGVAKKAVAQTTNAIKRRASFAAPIGNALAQPYDRSDNQR